MKMQFGDVVRWNDVSWVVLGEAQQDAMVEMEINTPSSSSRMSVSVGHLALSALPNDGDRYPVGYVIQSLAYDLTKED